VGPRQPPGVGRHDLGHAPRGVKAMDGGVHLSSSDLKLCEIARWWTSKLSIKLKDQRNATQIPHPDPRYRKISRSCTEASRLSTVCPILLRMPDAPHLHQLSRWWEEARWTCTVLLSWETAGATGLSEPEGWEMRIRLEDKGVSPRYLSRA
jgi:hypothetical protein